MGKSFLTTQNFYRRNVIFYDTIYFIPGFELNNCEFFLNSNCISFFEFSNSSMLITHIYINTDIDIISSDGDKSMTLFKQFSDISYLEVKHNNDILYITFNSLNDTLFKERGLKFPIIYSPQNEKIRFIFHPKPNIQTEPRKLEYYIKLTVIGYEYGVTT